MHASAMNWAAFAAAIVANFLLGAIWYSPPLFVRQWQAETGISDQDMGKRMPVALPAQVIASVVTAFVLVHLIIYAGATSAVAGAGLGAVCWLAFTAMPSLGYLAFGSRSRRLVLIDNGYHLIGLIIMGAILGGWR